MEFEIMPPVVIRGYRIKGKKRLKKAIRRLREGRGMFADDLAEAVERVAEDQGMDLAGKTVVPVVLVYKRTSKRKKLRSLFDLGLLR